MKRHFIAVVALFLLLGLCAVGNATIRHVPFPYPTIQSALNACLPGDSVEVADGTYFENIQWPATDQIKLYGASANPATCIIDGSNALDPVIVIPPEHPVSLLRVSESKMDMVKHRR